VGTAIVTPIARAIAIALLRRVRVERATSSTVERAYMRPWTSAKQCTNTYVGFIHSPTVPAQHQVLIAARAAGVPNPITVMFTAIDDQDGFNRFARQSRALGYDGIMVIHPGHVAAANAIFSPDAEAVSGARSVLEALELAGRNGDGAIRHDGRMIDTAMADNARRVVAEHEIFSRRAAAAEATP
jgi:citrate lyase subunit beta/citryl-CoA lyase